MWCPGTTVGRMDRSGWSVSIATIGGVTRNDGEETVGERGPYGPHRRVVTGKCQQCGEATPPRKPGPGANRLYCSDQCCRAWHREHGVRPVGMGRAASCDWCQSVYQRSRGNARYCSKRCGYRAARMRREYQITGDQFHRMVQQQGGTCALCRQVPDVDRPWMGWQVDHDHNTGEIRGLLCGPCNRILGYAHDDPELLRAMAAYVEGRGQLFAVK